MRCIRFKSYGFRFLAVPGCWFGWGGWHGKSGPVRGPLFVCSYFQDINFRGNSRHFCGGNAGRDFGVQFLPRCCRDPSAWSQDESLPAFSCCFGFALVRFSALHWDDSLLALVLWFRISRGRGRQLNPLCLLCIFFCDALVGSQPLLSPVLR